MGENLALFSADFNGSLRIEPRPERLTSDAGAVILREILERLGIVGWMVDRLRDPRDPDLITHYGVPAVQVDRLGLDNPPAARVEIGA